MREILFRGKRISNGEWVEGGIVRQFHPNFENESGGDFWEKTPNCYCICANNKDYFVEQYTIGQYTGLKDKNGKKIFEGDIMKFSAYGEDYIGIVYIITGNTCILCNNKKASPFLDHAIEKYGAECIGNIFDNSKLV